MDDIDQCGQKPTLINVVNTIHVVIDDDCGTMASAGKGGFVNQRAAIVNQRRSAERKTKKRAKTTANVRTTKSYASPGVHNSVVVDADDGQDASQNTGRREEGGREWIASAEATKLLGIKKETLYSYASRGLVRSQRAVGRSGQRLYHRGDLERLRDRSRARSGHGPVAAGALRWGEPVLETSIGTVRAEGPIYRGRTARDLVREGKTFEEVCALLWESPFETPFPRPSHRKRDQQRRLTHDAGHAAAIRKLLPTNAEPFDAMLVMASVLAIAEPRGEAINIVRQRAGDIVRRLVAACALPRDADVMREALDAGDVARSLLIALGGRVTKTNIDAITAALVLSADHELNVSTFTARITTSTGANLPAALVAALASLSGPLHGAATARVEAFATEVQRAERAAEIVKARLDRGESVPGFGHPLYPEGDPRGLDLLALAQRMSTRSSRTVRILTSITNAMYLVAHELPTIDVGLVALASALGLPRGAPLAIFACGRLAGWIAHAIEQREVGHLLRPRARYVGQ